MEKPECFLTLKIDFWKSGKVKFIYFKFEQKSTPSWPLSSKFHYLGQNNVQVNLCQKLLFLHQLTHNMTTDYSWNYHELSVVILWVSWWKNKYFWKRFTCTNKISCVNVFIRLKSISNICEAKLFLGAIF